MRLPDNYFRMLSPADIIAKVATITLANISLWGTEELERIGWLNNPVIDILYSMTSTGVWIARTDTSGLVAEANSSTIADHTGLINGIQLVGALRRAGFTEAEIATAQIQCGSYAVSLGAGGTLAETTLHSGTAGKKLFLVEVSAFLSMAADTAGSSAKVTIKEETAGTILTRFILGQYSHSAHLSPLTECTTADKDFNIVVEAGGVNVGASVLYVNFKYIEFD